MNVNSQLSEIAGIHAGDGYLRYSGRRKELDISGGIDEKEYYDNHVIPLFNKEFNLNLKGKFFKSRNTYGFVVRNRQVIEIFKKLGFPSGKKSTTVRCPKEILNSSDPKILRSFLRGYFDTDGSLTFDKKVYNKNVFKKTRNFYPRFMFTCVSQSLTKDIIRISTKLGFKALSYSHKSKIKTEKISYKTQIVGKINLRKWMKEIGIKNHSKYTRYLIWQKYGFCPPNTTYDQRLNILRNNLNPYSICAGL
jgi:intein/homing endonuclease